MPIKPAESDLLRAAKKVAAFAWGTSVSEDYHYHRLEAMQELRAAIKAESKEAEPHANQA